MTEYGTFSEPSAKPDNLTLRGKKRTLWAADWSDTQEDIYSLALDKF